MTDNRPRLLLHSCCAPCSSSVLERLCPDYRVTVFYYNPNIWPEAEYLRRKAEQIRLIGEVWAGEVDYIGGDYRPEVFEAAARGLEDCPERGARCERCFALRLGCTARKAAELGFDCFCSTLTVSPHKDAAVVNRVGREAGERAGVPWLTSDFKKKDGYLRSLQLSEQYGFYRQRYCGCRYAARPEDKQAEAGGPESTVRR